MSDAATLEARAQLRKERVHTTMLIELLVLLVFLAMTFAFISRDELSTSALQARVTQLEKQLVELQRKADALRRENRELKIANKTLDERLRRWMNLPRKDVPANPGDAPISVPAEQWKDMANDLANSLAIAEALQKENERLRGLLGKGGTDLPNCLVTPGFLLAIDLTGDGGIRVAPAWAATANSKALSVPGVKELVRGGAISATSFRAAASRVQTWGKNQSPPCGFRVSVRERHGNLELYKRQLKVIEASFYVARR